MATHSYSLQWGDHQTVLSSAVMNCSSDVTLVCGDVHIPAIRLVLSASSTIFYSLLKEAPQSPIMISLPETNHDHLHSLLTFLRTGQLKVTKDEFVQVQATALHLQMYSFSALKTLPTTENMPPTFMVEEDLNDSESGKPPGLPEEKIVHIVSEEEFLKIRRRMVDKRLKKVSEEDGRSSWKCDICGEKWVGKVSKDKRRAVRHMELHLRERVSCSLCGISFMTLGALYNHKSKSCKNKAESERDTESKEVDGVVENAEEDDLVEDMVIAVNPDKLNISLKESEASGSNPNDNINDVKEMEEDMAKVDDVWYCLICEKFWHAKGKCKRHMQIHNPCKLACKICGRIVNSKYMLVKHVHSGCRERICNSVKENKIESGLNEDGQTNLINDGEAKLVVDVDESNNSSGAPVTIADKM